MIGESNKMETMNINAKQGSRVIFKYPTNGYKAHQELAQKHLTEGEVYTVVYTDVSQSSTRVLFEEVPNVWFNSVLFEDAQ